MFLLVASRLSTSFCTRSMSTPFQGLIQGNSTASPRFILIAILLIRYLYNKGLVYPSESLISKVIYHLAKLIFIDDSEFNIMNNGEESILNIANRAQ